MFSASSVYAQEIDPTASPDEIRAAAADILERMEGSLSDVEAMQTAAGEEEGDVSRSQCIGDAAAAIQGFVALAGDASANLDAALSSGDAAGAEHQAGIINIAAGRVQNLVGAANQCSGDILTFAGEGGTEVSIDDSIPDDSDETDTGAADEQLSELIPDEPLPEATPYQ